MSTRASNPVAAAAAAQIRNNNGNSNSNSNGNSNGMINSNSNDAGTETLLRFAHALRHSIRSTALGEAAPVMYGTDSSKERAGKLAGEISSDLFIVTLKQAVLKRMSASKRALDEADDSVQGMSRRVISILEDMKMKDVLAMVSVSLYEKASNCATARSPFDRQTLCQARQAKDETVACIRDIRTAWEEGINEELQAMAVEMKRPFARRLEGGQHPLLDSLVSVSARETVRFLFDSEDLLETAAAIREPVMSRVAKERCLGLLKVPLITPTLSDLSRRYHELHVYSMQFGIDDLSARYGVKFSQTRHVAGEDAINHSYDSLAARKQLRSGAPPSLRGRMWRIALGLSPEPSDADREEYASLVRHCNREELLTDSLYIMDVVAVADDTSYFVFDDNMREVALCFSRDTSIPTDADFLIHAPLYLPPESAGVVLTEGEEDSTGPPVACPPNGIQPFLGFAKYIAPLCYLYLDNVAIYTAMRAMYCRLWCAMNVISSTPGTLYHVCQTFERLLIEGSLKLYSHLVSLKVEPLQV
jgi:hypothetical protein